MKLFCETSSAFELDNIKNAAILRDFLIFWIWQRQKWNNSARQIACACHAKPHLSVCLPIDLSSCLASHLSIDRPIYLSICLSVCLSIYLSVYLSICKLENEAILRDFLSFWTWQHQKGSNSARLPQFLNLTTSKTKPFCETSSLFEVDNIKNDRILRHFLQKWKVVCSADGLVPMRFAIFPVHLSKLLRLPRKSDARSYEVLHLSRKIISANLKIWCSKMQPLSGSQRPPTS